MSEFITVDYLDPSIKNIVVFDDCVTDKKEKIIQDLYIRGRKKNASIIYLTQSCYSDPINVRRNCNYCIFFKLQPKEIKQILREIDGNLSKEEFRKKCEFSSEDQNNFLTLDFIYPKIRYRKNFEFI